MIVQTMPYPGGGSGPVPEGAHRYLRINVTANNGDTFLAIKEVQAYDMVTNAPVDFSGATITASSSLTNYEVQYAFDGDYLTDVASFDAWAATSDTGSITIDFGSGNAVELGAITLFARYSFASQAPKDFTVDVSDDGTTWATLITVTNSTSWAGGEPRTFVSPAISYSGSPFTSAVWELFTLENNGTVATALSELEFRATTGGADQASGGTASAGSVNNGFVAADAFDNNNSTFWAASSTVRTYLRYAFASSVYVGQIAITARPSFTNDTPKRFLLLCGASTSGPWFTAGHWDGATGWSASETRTFTIPNYV